MKLYQMVLYRQSTQDVDNFQPKILPLYFYSLFTLLVVIRVYTYLE